jgi:hypothetical protein
MFLIKAGTIIQIEVPKTAASYHNWAGWKPYITKEDKIYDKAEIWDAVAVHNGRDDVPEWARRNITEHGYVVIQRAGKFAMCKPSQILFLD